MQTGGRSEHGALGGLEADLARSGLGSGTGYKIILVAVGDEAELVAFGLVGDTQPEAGGLVPDIILVEIAERESHVGEEMSGHVEKKI